MVRSRNSDWYIRIQHPNGNWAEAEVVGQPTRKPRVNALPGIRVPVRADDKWDDEVWEEQEMQVYYKGVRQPIEQFERVERAEGTTEIVGRGGVELRNIVDTEYQEEESTVVADEVITNNTSYTANVDAIEAGIVEDSQIDSATTTADYDNRTTTLSANSPFDTSGDSFSLAQASWGEEAEDSGFGSYDPAGDSRYSAGDSVGLGGQFGTTGDSVSFSFTPQYDIPASNVEMAVRWNPIDEDSDGNVDEITGLKWEVDGEAIFQTGSTFGLLDPDTVRWRTESGLSSDLTAGNNVNVNIELTANGASDHDSVQIDYFAVYDNRFSWTLDNSVDANGYLEGPQNFPNAQEFTLDPVTPAQSVVGGRVDGNFDDTTGGQAVALSNDDATYTTANNTGALDVDFGSAGPSLYFRVTLDRYGTQSNATPTTGINGQSMLDHTLYADLQPIPFVINKTFNDRVERVLNEIADTGDFVWEFQIDETGNKTVEFTTSEQREVVTDLPITSFNINKDISNRIERIILFGATNKVSREGITADHGNPVALGEDYLAEGSESVFDSGSDTRYFRGNDYTISYKDGTITALASGNISDGQAIDVAYDYSIRAEDQVDGVSNPRTEVLEIPGISTQELADNLVVRILAEVSDLDETVDVTIPADVERFSAIDAINSEELPSDETFQIETIEGTPEQIVVRGGTREDLKSLTNQIRSQLRTVSKRS